MGILASVVIMGLMKSPVMQTIGILQQPGDTWPAEMGMIR